MDWLRSRDVDTWLFGGWATELRGISTPCPHHDVDLLYPAENFDRVDELLGSLDEITAKRFPHKRAFEFDGIMVELFLVRFDGRAHYTSFWNSYRYEWADDVFADDRIVGVNALADFRRNFDRIRAAAPTVRPAATADIPTAVRMRDEAAEWQQQRGIDQWRVGEAKPAYYERRMAADELFIAEQWDGRIVGMVTVVWSDDEIWGTQEIPAGYIHGLVVDRAFAGYGYGRLLLEWAEQHIFAHGRRMARLDYVASNDRLGRYYAAAGYRVVGSKTFPNSTWQPDTLVEKPLP
jgi:protein-tyrosine phosphatase